MDYLDKTGLIIVGHGPVNLVEGPVSYPDVIPQLFTSFGFVETGPGYFRFGEGGPGHDLAEAPVIERQHSVTDGLKTLPAGQMGKLVIALDTITHSVDVLDICPQIFVNRNAPG